LFYFILYTSLFGELLYLAKSNKAEVEEYVGKLPQQLGYFFISWGNGIGNIVNPSYDKPGDTFLDKVILYVIYLIWWLNQVIVLIIFLNFVIAVVGDVFSTIMDSKNRYIYGLR